MKKNNGIVIKYAKKDVIDAIKNRLDSLNNDKDFDEIDE
jgi:hypothetical protein